MQNKLVEKNKQAGVYYAFTDDGVELPVIDVSHKAFFVVQPSEAEVEDMIQRACREAERHNRLPAWLRKIVVWWFARKSILMQGLRGTEAGFLSGMNTYLMKLGPDNLGRAYAGKVDKMIALSLPARSTRLRMRDTARFLADGLMPALAAKPGKPLHFINIAGGPCADSLNALILLRAEKPELVENRAIKIHALDLHVQGPDFGIRALAALQAPDAPLHGLDIALDYITYDWEHTQTLADYLGTLGLAQDVAAASSEGGLLHYGTDRAITDNLQVLGKYLPKDSVFVGSYTRSDVPSNLLHNVGNIQTLERSVDEIAALADQGNWKAGRDCTQITSRVVLFHKQG